MQAVIIAIVTTLIGVVVAVLAARHYYTRSVKHRLAVYWLPAPSILFGVDQDTRKELSIQFRGEVVNELAVTEFLVANEGADPIRENIEPLAFSIKNEIRIVDASITYVQPEGRKVVIELASEKRFRCDFPLLNPGDYFYIKLITDGAVKKSDMACEIAAENLPPRIPIENPTRVTISPDDEKHDLWLLIPAAVCLIIAAAIFLPIVGLYQAHHSYFPFSGSHYQFVWWLTPFLGLAALVALILLILTGTMCVNALVGDIPPSRRFKGPRRSYHPHLYGYGYYPFPASQEPESPLTRYPRE